MMSKSAFAVCLLGIVVFWGDAGATTLSPDDASIRDSLCLWLRNPDTYYDPGAGVWTDLSGKGNDARADVDGFAGPTLSTGENAKVFPHAFSTVHCDPAGPELLRATDLNGGAGLTDLTIFSVVRVVVPGGTDQRAVGFGAYTDDILADCFNMSFDLTVRKNNGYISGKNQDLPRGEYVIYAARMDPDSITMWLNSAGTLSEAFNAVGSSYNTATDAFYVGELRYSPAGDFDVAEVVVFNTALTDDQVTGICDWLQTHVGIDADEAYPFAFGPNPLDGAMLETTTTTLGWKAGDLALSHEVYVGETFDAVDQTLVDPIPTTETTLSTIDIPAYAGGFTPGQTYYWRVDEVDETHPDSPWKGDVWSFWIRPAVAWDPTPPDGVEFVHPDQVLTWEPGMGTLFHTVYFGDSFDEVNEATFSNNMTTDPTFTPGPLEINKTYYWRVDEFSTASTTLKGDVWSFTTVPEVAVTDPNLALWWTLEEGMGITAVDWSGHGHHGIVSGGAQWTEGYQGTALTFADNVYVESIGYSGITGTADRTCCAWIKAMSANCNIMSWGENVAGQKWIMRLDATGGLRVEVNGGYHYGVTNLADNHWHHVAITLADEGTPDALDTLLYVDGQLEATADSLDEPIDTAATGAVRIGECPWHNRPFIGEIDDARIYDTVLTVEEIAQAMRGNPLLAANPDPDRNAIVDIRTTTVMSWSPGDTAASHDVYFGTDRDAVAAADRGAAAFQGNQAAASLSLSALIEFGGGDYYWRIDEVEADGTVHQGNVWKFTVPDYLTVDDFESYTNDSPHRVFQTWIDGIGFSPDDFFPDGNPGNGTGAAAGHDIWSGDSPYYQGQIMETANVYAGAQAMPIYYSGDLSEVERTFTPAQDWTFEGVTTLVMYFRGETDNTGQLYVKINGTKVPYNGDPTDIASSLWVEWPIDLASVGTNLTNVTTLTIGIEGGNEGVLYVDEIRLTP